MDVIKQEEEEAEGRIVSPGALRPTLSSLMC
jgi:hypothetical protein